MSIVYTLKNSATQVEMNPPETPTHTIIWLHGLGANGHDFATLVPQLQLPSSMSVRFVFPNAPVRPITLYQGQRMRAWFDIKSRDIDRIIDKKDIDQSVHSIHQIIDLEKSIVSPHHIILAGFSQGAAIALAAGLTYSELLGGIMSLSGCFPHGEAWILQSNANKKIPLFVAHGIHDDILPVILSEQMVSMLQSENHPVTFQRYPMAHSVCDQEIKDITAWLEKIS